MAEPLGFSYFAGGGWLIRRADRDPAHLALSDVEADFKAEGIAIEGEGGFRVVVWEEARVNSDVHGVRLGAAQRQELLDF